MKRKCKLCSHTATFQAISGNWYCGANHTPQFLDLEQKQNARKVLKQYFGRDATSLEIKNFIEKDVIKKIGYDLPKGRGAKKVIPREDLNYIKRLL